MIHSFIILNLFFVTLVCSVIPICESYIINFVIFLLLFMSLIVLFGTIHGSYYSISATFSFIYSTFTKNFLILTK